MINRLGLGVVHRLVVAGFAVCLLAASPRPPVPATTVTLSSTSGATQRFAVEVARTPEQQQRGLMQRTQLPLDHGMLFVFDPPQRVAFWMKNTPLSLDLLFIDDTGQVVRITPRAVPHSTRLLESGAVVRYVLEINAGEAARRGIGVGSQMRWSEK